MDQTTRDGRSPCEDDADASDAGTEHEEHQFDFVMCGTLYCRSASELDAERIAEGYIGNLKTLEMRRDWDLDDDGTFISAAVTTYGTDHHGVMIARDGERAVVAAALKLLKQAMETDPEGTTSRFGWELTRLRAPKTILTVADVSDLADRYRGAAVEAGPVYAGPARAFIGYQAADRSGQNIQGEGDPSGLTSFEVMTPDLASRFMAKFGSTHEVQPIFAGDIEAHSMVETAGWDA